MSQPNFIQLPSICHPRTCLCILYTHANTPKCLFSSSPFTTSGFDGNIDSQGELILQESFQVWDPKTLIRKGRDRHLFLFEMSLVFSKEVKDSNGRSKYLFKSKLFVSNIPFDPSILFLFFPTNYDSREIDKMYCETYLWTMLGSYGCITHNVKTTNYHMMIYQSL